MIEWEKASQGGSSIILVNDPPTSIENGRNILLVQLGQQQGKGALDHKEEHKYEHDIIFQCISFDVSKHVLDAKANVEIF